MDKNTQINNFITEVVDGWMLGDLGALTDLPFQPSGNGNCNFPIALYTFACVEFLGQLTYAGKSLPKSGYTQASIMGFIDDFFPDDFKKELQPHRANFVNMFRNGLAHNYFAKAAGVSRTETKPFSVEGGYLTLDADCFASAFRSAVDVLKNAIQSDPDLIERMLKRYNAQEAAHSKFKLTPKVARLLSTPTSGASLLHPDALKKVKTVTTTSPTVSSAKTTTTLPFHAQKKKPTS